jgi:RND superfamily putative drug exporter
MLLTGRHTWWMPRWLDRILPDISIEGESHPRPAGPAPDLTPAPAPNPA